MPADPAPDTLHRLGGAEGLRRIVDRFYDLVAADPVLAPLFPADLTETRDKQWAYFVEFFGGPKLYSERHGKPFLRFKHRRVTIGRPERDAWMACLGAALRAEVADEALVAEVEARVAPIADAMVNHRPGQQDAYYFR